jgi:hypothetical protein
VILDEEASRAVVAYLGKGTSSWPRADVGAAMEAATVTDPGRLASATAALVEECLGITVDWLSVSLSEGGDQAREEMARRHPQLGPSALEALRWAFTYHWR